MGQGKILDVALYPRLFLQLHLFLSPAIIPPFHPPSFFHLLKFNHPAFMCTFFFAFLPVHHPCHDHVMLSTEDERGGTGRTEKRMKTGTLEGN